MQVNGIIAEYNPFHNGHKYQLDESLLRTGADFTIVVMSGNFVQRGAPALADKRLRAETALRCGADLVLELPVLYATASAEHFADGAAALLDRLGIVTHLCFGSECGDTAPLDRIARILLEEPPRYRAALKDCLRQGLSFPAARARALPLCDSRLERYRDILSSPNNILGVDYIRALAARKSGIIPVTIKRLGGGYHDGRLEEAHPGRGGEGHAPFSSALAIREALRQGQPPSVAESHMPAEAGGLLRSYLAENRPLWPDDFSAVLYYKLLMEKENGFGKYLDVTDDLSNRIRNRLHEFNGFSGFCSLLKTKEMTYARISRCLLHILLGIEDGHMELGKSLDYAPYARVLGFRKASAPLLHAVKAHSAVPLVTKLADAEKKLEGDAYRLLRLDILTSEFYRGTAAVLCGRTAPDELTLTPIIV